MRETDFGADVAGRAINSATVATLKASTEALADELHSACDNYRRARGFASVGAGTPIGLCKLSEMPAPSPDQSAAEARVRSLGRRLFDQGGDRRMIEVYDAAVEKYDYTGVFGANAVWDGIGAWAA
jgi:hypothetical protein